MADIESNIDININAQQALASIKQLQAQISAFHQAMSKSGAEAVAKSAQMQQKLVDSINITGKWSASIKQVQTSTESFTTSLEKNKFSLGEYFKFGASQVSGFRKIFSTEFDTIDKVARERVKTLQTQYIKLGRDANGAMQSIAVRPLKLDMNDLGTQVMMTSQKQQVFNELLKQGSTNLLNFGKNTQWAGRQLMVGFSVPLSIFGAAAAREFMKLEEQTVRFQKVYGDFSTSSESTDKMADSIKNLGLEFTKYGVAVEKTMGLAADAAAMGKTGADLTAQVTEATKLAVLGGVDQQKALETTISLTNAFGVSAEKLSGKVNFLNAVENQTVTSIEDLTTAIPTAGPVIQQLGGNVEDLAFFLTAMKEGGIDASEGANALKSGLASMINPTGEAVDMLNQLGINLQGIVEANKGDVKATVVGFAEALNTLDPLNRAQAIEQLFGKFQFARISTLFQNITDQASQANRVLQLTSASSEELAVLSEREMKRMEDSPMYKFQSAVEKFQTALAPVGETFLKAVTPIIDFGTDLLNKFNEMDEGAKQFWTVLVAAVAGIGPVLLMAFGLIANGAANVIKLFALVGGGLKALSGGSRLLGGDTAYMTEAQLQAASVAASLNQIHQNLIQTITAETAAVTGLANAYQAAAVAGSSIATRIGTGGGKGPVKKMATGGIISGPGTGTSDSVPFMGSNGEAIIPAANVKKFPGLVSALISGKIPGFKDGGILSGYTNAVAFFSSSLNQAGKKGAASRSDTLAELQSGGQAIYSPIITAIAEKMGAKSQQDIIKMVEENPEFRNFAQHLSTGIIDGVASGTGNVSDAEIEKHARKAAGTAKGSKAFKNAVNEVFTEITTIEDDSLKRVKSSGAVTAQGRTSLLEKVKSYRGRDGIFKAVASMLPGALPENYQLSHVVERTRGDIDTLAGGRTLSRPAEDAKKRLASGMDTVYRQGAPGQFTFVPRGASPQDVRAAMDEAERAGTLVGNAYTAAVKKTTKDPYVTSRDRKSPHRLAAKDGMDDGQAYGEARGEAIGVASEKDIAKEASRQRRARIASRVMGAGMVATTALGAMSMMGGPVGDFAQGALPIAGAASTILPMLMSMPPQIAIVVAALGTLAAGAIAFSNAMGDARKKSLDLVEALGAGSKAIDKLAEFAGTASATSIMNKRRENAMSPFQVQEGKSTFGENYMGSDAGKALMNGVKDAMKNGSNTQSIQSMILNQMGSAVASGVLSGSQARSIVSELAKELGDYNFGIQVNGKLLELLGPNGENILKDPIGVRVKLMQETGRGVSGAQQNLSNVSGAQTPRIAGGVASGIAGGVLGGIGGAMVGSAATGAALGSIVPGAGTAIGAGVGAIVGVAAGAFQVADAMTKLESAAGAVTAQGIMAMQQQQEMLDSLQLDYEKRIGIAKAAGDAAEAERLQTEYVKGRQAIIDQGKATQKGLVGQYEKADWATQGAMGRNLDTAIEGMYKDDPLRQQVANSAKDQIIGANITQGQEYQLKLSLASGNLDPTVLNNFLSQFGQDNKTMNAFMNVTSNLGDAEGSRALQISNMFVDKDGNPKPEQQQKFMMNVSSAVASGKGSQYLDLFTEVAKSGEVLNVSAVFEYIMANPDVGTKLIEDINKLKEKAAEGTITFDIVQNLYGAEIADIVAANQDYFNSLDPEQRVTYIQTLLTVYETKGTPEGKADMANWLAANPGKNQLDYFGNQAYKVTEANKVTKPKTTGGGSTSSGGGGGTQTSVLDDLMKKLKQVQMASIKVTEGWAASRKALDNLFPGGGSNSPFQGLEQQMRRLGAKEDLITMIAGMDPKEFEKRKNELFTFDGAGNIVGFRDSLLSIGAALRSIKFGEFQSAQQKNINVLRDQNEAIRKLIANGFSMAEAYDMVKDASFASAVAQEGNNDVIRQATEDYRKATEAAKLFAAAQSGATENAKTSTRRDMLSFISANAGRLSNAVIEEMQKNEDFASLIMSPNLTDQQRTILQQWINNIENDPSLQLSLDLTNITGMEKVFNDGFNKAMDAFSAQEKKIDIEFDIKKDPFQKIVDNAQNLIADIQNRPGGLDDLQADLERIAIKEDDINKAYKARLDALQQVKKSNDAIIQQRRSELTIADALTQGDIAAAAKAVEDARTQQAQAALQTQEDLLNRQKQAEIDALTATMGLTKEQIDTRIRDLRQQILNIEETMLEPAQYQLTLLDRQVKRQKESLTVLGMTRRQWETMKNRIDIAKTSSDEYKKAMEAARDVVGKIVDYWTEIQKPKTTVHTIITRYENGGGAGSGNIGASGDGGSGGGGSDSGGTDPEAQKNATRVSLNNAIASARSQLEAAAKERNELLDTKHNAWAWFMTDKADWNIKYGNVTNRLTAAQNSLRSLTERLAGLATGGMVKSKYFADGGSIFKAMGTDTVPAMLTPGEFVVSKSAVDRYGASMLRNINNETFESGSMYNNTYSININVKSDANADDIARTVMTQIKNVDAQRIRSNRF